MPVPRQSLRPDFSTPRIIKGNWQIAGDHSLSIGGDDEMYTHMAAFFDAGITAFDCGDIYYGVEERIGKFITRFRAERGDEAAREVAVYTKYCPAFLDEAGLRAHSRADVCGTVDCSLQRLNIEQLDLVQFHWWNYDIDGSVQAALWLQELQQEGKVKHIGLTNFNVAQMDKIVQAGVKVVCNQVQYSVLDRRPQLGMDRYCQAHDIAILGYGGIAGGFLSEKWKGFPDPGKPAFENVSLDKYYRIICDFGGWALYQDLLSALEGVSKKHGVGVPAVAARYVLDQPAVAAVIQGARHSRHIDTNLQVFDILIDDEDRAAIEAVLAKSKGPLGDCYDLDRAENRDAVEELKIEYFDIENGALVRKSRPPLVIDVPYGHHGG